MAKAGRKPACGAVWLSPRTKNKLLVVMRGILRRAQKVWGLTLNPVAAVEVHQRVRQDTCFRRMTLLRATVVEAPVFLPSVGAG